MHIDLLVVLTGLGVGLVVGLTGMGGGALMTPILVLFFGIQPLAAVSSDLVAALVMKPVGGAVHLRRGTVHRGLVTWLVIGSVPSAFAGVLILRALGDGEGVQTAIKTALGVALLLAATSILAKNALAVRRRTVEVGGPAPADVPVRKLPTLAIGVLGGLVVGMTSVGSGSLMIVLLLVLYPRLTAGSLVGTDLVQAVPLVASAALGHLLFGDVQLGLTTSLIIGSVPGVYVGARISSRANGALIRRLLVVVLLASGVKLLGASMVVLLAVAIVAAVVVSVGALVERRAAVTDTPDAPEHELSLR